MERQIFEGGKKIVINGATLYNNDTVIVHHDKKEMPDNSVHMILTSIPFGDHYEYSDNYNDMGHNHGNHKFFEQMDFLTPNLLRVLKPGRVAAIHVKDRIRYSYQNGTKFTTIDDFSGQTVAHFTKEHVKNKIEMITSILKGLKERKLTPEIATIMEEMEIELHELRQDYKNRFYLMGKITVTTDVVRENNQTYRLGWTEQCKDASKMGCGMPEYILLFRKAPTHIDNAYADEPVSKNKEDILKCNKCGHNESVDLWNEFYDDSENDNKFIQCEKCNQGFMEYINGYDISMWQLDAHAYYRSNGNRFLTYDEIGKLEFAKICQAWEKYNKENVYSFSEHLQACQYLEEFGKLSKLFTTLPVHSNTDMVWTDVNRMNTLNAKQVNGKKEKHICPLQIDIIKRLINRYSMPGEIIDDPFGGLFSTPYVAMQMCRKSISVELNTDYFKDGVFYINAINHKISIPTLFDLLTEESKTV